MQHAMFERFDVLAKLSIRSTIIPSSALLTLLFAANLLPAAPWSNMASCLGISLGLLSGFLLHRAALMALERVRHGIERMSAGDLTRKISAIGNDESAQLLQALRVLQTNVKLLRQGRSIALEKAGAPGP